MSRVSFVILHFLNIEDTIKSVESITESQKYQDFHIVLVDNCSPDGSGKLLEDKYQEQSKITTILTDRNLGFAKGNNVGYKYARETLKSNFIVVINNDVFIRQSDFIEKIIARYDKRSFDILGPDIISLVDQGHQNPRKEILFSADVVAGYISRYKFMYPLSLFGLDLTFLKMKKNLMPGSKLTAESKDPLPFDREQEDVKLHGSALVFSPSFVKKYTYCFYPDTHMYNEESILYYIAKRDRLKTLYYPAAVVYHKEDGATDAFLKSSRRKRSFYYKNFIQSAQVLLTLMLKNNQQ